MDKLKRMAVMQVEGTICESYGANWYFMQELFCRWFGKTYDYQCGHSSKGTVLRVANGKLHACMLLSGRQAPETLCSDCTLAAYEEDRQRMNRIFNTSIQEKMRIDFIVAAEKTTAQLLEMPEIKGSPEKAAKLAELLQKLKDEYVPEKQSGT